MAGHIRLPQALPDLAAAAAAAHRDPYGARGLLTASANGHAGPDGDVIVAGWVFSHDFHHTLLVRHHRFGWLSPGGRLEAGESPLAGARREVAEETGLDLHPLLPDPVALLGNTPGRRERVYGLAYAFAADPATALTPETGQPAAWFTLERMPPCPVFPLDDQVLAHTARDLARTPREPSWP
ncbi:NUDIX hydrolase [Streptomyces resistomycificus]|uniref:NUDIX hydrolase n=1 Tax=Streptomyces resistomycificus TaxID=67356 RepID=UPI000B22952D|nr:NUDIX hydrolase [Streptomyces resistomycificus]